MTDVNCPFCTKLANLPELPKDEVVWQFPHSVALLGPWQFYRGYCVLVSRMHARELFHLDPVLRRAYLDEMCLLAQAVAESFSPHKMNYELLGNQVPHLHWHVFPRRLDDPHHLQPVWLALDQAERDTAERARLLGDPQECGQTVALLRASLTRLSDS